MRYISSDKPVEVRGKSIMENNAIKDQMKKYKDEQGQGSRWISFNAKLLGLGMEQFILKAQFHPYEIDSWQSIINAADNILLLIIKIILLIDLMNQQFNVNDVGGFGQLTEADLIAITQMRNESLLQQIEGQNNENARLRERVPQIRRSEFFVVLQMKLVFFYMYCVNHENRYILDRMMHIFWVLAMLVLLQFHLLHISSFSYINCMSETIIQSLEDHQINHVYEQKTMDANFDAHNLNITGQMCNSSVQSCVINPQTFLDGSYQVPSMHTIWNNETQFQDGKTINNHNLSKKKRYNYQMNDTYFKQFFDKTTDVYFLRVVDQLSQMNQQTSINNQTWETLYNLGQQESLIINYMLHANRSTVLDNLIQQVNHLRGVVDDFSLQNIQQANNGYYVFDDSLCTYNESSRQNGLPDSFPPCTKSQFEHANDLIFQNDIERLLDDNMLFIENSQILRLEMAGQQNMIVSSDKDDIMLTTQILNDTFLHSTQKFRKVFRKELVEDQWYTDDFYEDLPQVNQFVNQITVLRDVYRLMQLVEKFFKVFSNFLSSQLMNDNFYAFSYNKTLIQMNVDQLREIPDLRVKYIQVGAMNKCIPQDWFLAYDQFAVYTFLNLAGQIKDQAGYLNTYFRPQREQFSLINNLDIFLVDYGSDFNGDLRNTGDVMHYLWRRTYLLLRTLFQLSCLFGTINVISSIFRELVFECFENGQSCNLNTTKLLKFGLIILLTNYLPLTLDFKDHPRSISLIAYMNLLYHNFGYLFLRDSTYHTKYYFYMFLATFLNYFYLKTYPFSNVTLTNIVYVTFIGYQLAHNLFKFSFQFEIILIHLARGNLAAILPARIQNVLGQRQIAREIEQRRIQVQQERDQIERQRQWRREQERLEREREEERVRLAHEQFLRNRERRLNEMEQDFREQAYRVRRVAGLQISRNLQNEIEEEVQEQMRSVRQVLSSSRYQEILNQFSDLINRPEEIIQSEDQHSVYQNYQTEVNRQISNIADVLNDVTIQNTQILTNRYQQIHRQQEEQKATTSQTISHPNQNLAGPETDMYRVNDPQIDRQVHSHSEEQLQQKKVGLQQQLHQLIRRQGLQFILDRSTRNRKYQDQFKTKQINTYTNKLKLIDDINELQEVISIGKRNLNESEDQQESFVSSSQSEQYLPDLNNIYQIVEKKIQMQRQKKTKQQVRQPKRRKKKGGSLRREEEMQEKFERISLQQDCLPVIQILIVNKSGKQSDNEYVKEMIKYREPSECNYTPVQMRFFQLNPTYILTFTDMDSSEEMITFVAEEIQKICRESIWRNPRTQNADPISVEQIHQYINLRLKMELEKEGQIFIERLIMKPIVDPKRDEVSDHNVAKYGKDKNVQTAVMYIKKQQHQQIKTNMVDQSTLTQGPDYVSDQSTQQIDQNEINQSQQEEVNDEDFLNILDQYIEQNQQQHLEETGQINPLLAQLPGLLRQLRDNNNSFNNNNNYNNNNIEVEAERANLHEEEKKQQVGPDRTVGVHSSVDSLSEEQPEVETFNLQNINHNLLIIFNQIKQAAYALRYEKQNEDGEYLDEQIPLTEEQVAADVSKQRQIESFKQIFFSDLDMSGLQVTYMNKDEKIFFRAMMNDFDDIVRLFPALYQLQSQMLILKLTQEQEQFRKRKGSLIRSLQSNIGSEQRNRAQHNTRQEETKSNTGPRRRTNNMANPSQ